MLISQNDIKKEHMNVKKRLGMYETIQTQ